MKVNRSEFLRSYSKPEQILPSDLPEFAFCGRSNVGKSSLINMLCRRKDMAHTSSSPGRTQTINHYLINQNWILADLPGYGYAKVSQERRKEWLKLMEEYILSRKNLRLVFVLVDSRISPQQSDLNFLSFLGENGIPPAIIFTKADRPGSQEIAANILSFQEALLEEWEELPVHFQSSVENELGRDEILSYIGQVIDETVRKPRP